MLSATLILFVTWMWFKSGLSIWCLVFAWVLWLLEESKWYAIKTNRKEKKFLKDSLTRSYRRKQKQGKLDAEQEQE